MADTHSSQQLVVLLNVNVQEVMQRQVTHHLQSEEAAEADSQHTTHERHTIR